MIKTEFPNTVAAASVLSTDDVQAMSGPDLVRVYNLLTEGEEVKRFATRADGVKRVTKLVVAAREAVKPAPVVAKVNGHAKKTDAAKAAKPLRVGARTEQLILSGLGVADVAAALRVEFPDKANSEANVRWYRGKLKREGRLA